MIKDCSLMMARWLNNWIDAQPSKIVAHDGTRHRNVVMTGHPTNWCPYAVVVPIDTHVIFSLRATANRFVEDWHKQFGVSANGPLQVIKTETHNLLDKRMSLEFEEIKAHLATCDATTSLCCYGSSSDELSADIFRTLSLSKEFDNCSPLRIALLLNINTRLGFPKLDLQQITSSIKRLPKFKRTEILFGIAEDDFDIHTLRADIYIGSLSPIRLID